MQDGGIRLNPPAGTVIGQGDRLVVLAADGSSIAVGEPGRVDAAAIGVASAPAPRPEHTLIIGHNDGVAEVLAELARYVPEGSQACLVSDDERAQAMPPPAGIDLQVVIGDTTSKTLLWSLELRQYDHILVLADADHPDPQIADARTLVTLLHLRDLASRANLSLNIVSEMRDDRNRELAEVARADDFIVSDRLVGLMLAQVSENPRLVEIFDELFSSEGCEIYLRPAELYLRPGAQTTFHTVLAAAAARGETAIGYRLAAQSWSREASYGIHLNPSKADPLALGPGDSVIVLADDEH